MFPSDGTIDDTMKEKIRIADIPFYRRLRKRPQNFSIEYNVFTFIISPSEEVNAFFDYLISLHCKIQFY